MFHLDNLSFRLFIEVVSMYRDALLGSESLRIEDVIGSEEGGTEEAQGKTIAKLADLLPFWKADPKTAHKNSSALFRFFVEKRFDDIWKWRSNHNDERRYQELANLWDRVLP